MWGEGPKKNAVGQDDENSTVMGEKKLPLVEVESKVWRTDFLLISVCRSRNYI